MIYTFEFEFPSEHSEHDTTQFCAKTLQEAKHLFREWYYESEKKQAPDVPYRVVCNKFDEEYYKEQGEEYCTNPDNFYDNPHLSEEMKQMIESMTSRQLEDIYSHMHFLHIREDAVNYLEKDAEDTTQEEIRNNSTTIAERLVYNGDVDCNLSYWDNIDAIMNEIKLCNN